MPCRGLETFCTTTSKTSYLDIERNTKECLVGVGNGLAAQAPYWKAKRNASQVGKETNSARFNDQRILL